MACKRPEQLKALILDDPEVKEADLVEAGVFEVKIFKNGEWIKVRIDSLFPVKKNGWPAFAKSDQVNELWVMVMEKAFAKVYTSYAAIESGFVDQALIDLTGGTAGRIDFKKEHNAVRNGGLWKRVLEYHKLGYLMGAGSPEGKDTDKSEFGIVQGHAYSLLDVVEVSGHQLVKLRNPWGNTEWNGDWRDDDPRWNRKMLARLGNDHLGNEGQFWMSFQDFTRHFQQIFLCRFFTDGWQKLDRILGSWSRKTKTAGGCTNTPACKYSPQYLLTVANETTVFISLGQSDWRGSTKTAAAIAIEVYAYENRRVQTGKNNRLVTQNAEGYIFRREVTCEFKFKPGQYVVFISTFNKNKETDYTIEAFSKPHNVTLELLQ